MRILREEVARQERVGLVGKVGERLVDQKADALLRAPRAELFDVLQGHEIAGGIVGIDENQVRDGILREEVDQILRAIAEAVLGRRRKDDAARFVDAIRVFLEGRIDKADLAGDKSHVGLNDLGRAIANGNLVRMEAEHLRREKRIHALSRGILFEERVEGGLNFSAEALTREVGRDEIAEILEPRIPPVTAETRGELLHLFLGWAEHRLGNI